ncbi:MAG: 4-hydroxyacetophenone monooxygenase, partial [Planctomycetaceae bacterium]
MNSFDIPGDDETIRAALTEVNLPTLLMVLIQFCEDNRWLAGRYKPDPIQVPEGGLFPDDTGNYSDDVAEEIREAGFNLLKNLRDNGGALPATPTQAAMQEMMSFSTAVPMEPEYARMLLEETNFVDRDQDWLKPIKENNMANLDDFNVIVVGAGMSGICTGIKLKKAGINYTILEKNDAVGGTWYENTYPDCGVDTPNHFYSYSFERNPEWSGYFSKRDELHAYFEKCTDQFEIRDNIQLKTEVSDMSYDSETKLWQVRISKNGVEETITANLVISAVGQLNRPAVPEFEGLDSFKGDSFHSARWDHDVSLEGKRVAVIGTGCSAVQLVPKTADKASHLTVFQRSPHWISPNKDYYKPVEDGLRWALKHVPFYAEWHR